MKKKDSQTMPKLTKNRHVTYSHNAQIARRNKIRRHRLVPRNATPFLNTRVAVFVAVIALSVAFNFLQLSTHRGKVAEAESVVVPRQLLFSDDFNNTLTLGWRPIDEGQPGAVSQWAVAADGSLQQSQPINAGSDERSVIDKPGTYLLTGNPDWTDYEYSVRVKSTDNHAIGIMFRYQGKDNYYRFSMDNKRSYQRLIKKINGRYTTLAENGSKYNIGQWYTLKVRAIGSNIQVFVDGNRVFNVNDSQLTSGKIALYNWRQQSAYYDDVTVKVSTDSFTVAVLPDTQYYSLYFPEVFTAQTEWLASERAKQNIAFVLHEGDVTHTKTAQEWRRALQSMRILDGKLPYAIVPGNHDEGSNLFDQYFPVSRYRNLPTFGGTFEPNKLDNNYHFFSAGGIDWLVIGLDYGPTDDKLVWANNLAAAHPDRHVIILTHAYLSGNNTRQGSGPTPDVVPKPPKNNGEEMWQELVKRQPNIQFVFSGHAVSPDGAGRLTSIGDNGNKVYQMLANYQSFGNRPGQMGVNGGNGYLRLVTFNPGKDTVEVKTYSPYLDNYLTDNDNQFTLTGVQL